jgi:poly(beta-D-mannuronate) lyase
MAKRATIMALAGLAAFSAAPAVAGEWKGLLDVQARAEELKTPRYASIRNACLKIAADGKWAKLAPVLGLSTTEGYGSDNRAEDFSWAVMVLSGRTLAGDAAARTSLTDLMLRWADVNAFAQTEQVNDAYYALKRQLLPIAVAYEILVPSLDEGKATRLKNWIDPLVRRIDREFDGDVDRNNHRVLADSVLAVWGALTGDEAMMKKGLSRYDIILSETRPDGTLELEARRGARALWYQRQTLSSMVVLAETAKGAGIDLYGQTSPEGHSLATLIGALMNGLNAPVLVAVYSAENHIPGPEKNYLKPDLGFLETRGHGRHYMAWAEAAVIAGDSIAYQRLNSLFSRTTAKQRPLIDEFAGGNATCFWGQP